MSPRECAEEQFAAYNAKDLERFLACFADEIRTVRLPDMTPLLSGKMEFREFFTTQRFNLVGLRAELVSRIVLDNTVVDHERIHGLGEEPVEMIVMMVVEQGLVTQEFVIPAKSPS